MASLLRGLAGIPLAAFIVLVLFLLMYGLIKVDEIVLGEDKEPVNIQIGRQIDDTDTTQRGRVERPELRDQPPPPPAVDRTSFTPDVEGVRAELPSIEADVDLGSSFNPDRDAQPLVRIPPRNFERCIDERQAGTTQRVTLEFNVTPDGSVTDVEVISSTDSCYNRSAIRSAEGWRYQPKIVDGQQAARIGVRTTIEYQIGE